MPKMAEQMRIGWDYMKLINVCVVHGDVWEVKG